MNILILGSGGREHALAWHISRSPLCKNLYIAPGNAGTAECGENIALDPLDFDALARFTLEKNIEMIIPGPEAPLVRGLYDYFTGRPELEHIRVCGPSAAAARLEGSKSFAKQFMQELDIPTARYQAFSVEEIEEGVRYLEGLEPPVVLKADGLAAGKGVLICQDTGQAIEEFRAMLQGKFGAAGHTVVIEEFLQGIEVSVFAMTDGVNYRLLTPAKDYKRIGEGDTGLNTGGMGAVTPVPFANEAFMRKITGRIVEPTIRGLADRGLVYKGILYFGLMNVAGDPHVIEYNCRFGDPEAEVLIPLIRSDLAEAFINMVDGTLDQYRLELDTLACTTVMLVSGGYPGSYEKGKVINGLETVEGSVIFHSGTRRNDKNRLLTNGGRVLAVTSLAKTPEQALAQSLKNAERIQFEGKYYRKDIGWDIL